LAWQLKRTWRHLMGVRSISLWNENSLKLSFFSSHYLTFYKNTSSKCFWLNFMPWYALACEEGLNILGTRLYYRSYPYLITVFLVWKLTGRYFKGEINGNRGGSKGGKSVLLHNMQTWRPSFLLTTFFEKRKEFKWLYHG